MTPTTPEIRQRIKATIVRCLELDMQPDDIGDEMQLFAPTLSGGLELDSLAAVEIVVALSNEFGVRLPEVPRAAFASPQTLAEFVATALESKPGG